MDRIQDPADGTGDDPAGERPTDQRILLAQHALFHEMDLRIARDVEHLEPRQSAAEALGEGEALADHPLLVRGDAHVLAVLPHHLEQPREPPPPGHYLLRTPYPQQTHC